MVGLVAVIAIMAVERLRFAGRDAAGAAAGEAGVTATGNGSEVVESKSVAVLPFDNRRWRAGLRPGEVFRSAGISRLLRS